MPCDLGYGVLGDDLDQNNTGITWLGIIVHNNGYIITKKYSKLQIRL